ncbi:unnamed protein product, partial [Meganyctiphanes norvegica]
MLNSGPTNIGPPRDRVLFPSSIPQEVRILVKAAPTMEKSLFRKLIKLSLGYLQQTLDVEECEAALKNICETLKCTSQEDVLKVSFQHAGVVILLKSALRINTSTVRQEALLADLQDIGLSKEFSTDVCAVVYGGARPDIDTQLMASTPHLPTLAATDWRVEVTISTSWLSRVLEPVVVLKLSNSEGDTHMFEVPQAKFHQLRYTVADLLSQMDGLESLSIFKKF